MNAGGKKNFFLFCTLISKITNLSTNFIASLNQTVCDGGRHIFFIHKNLNITISFMSQNTAKYSILFCTFFT